MTFYYPEQTAPALDDLTLSIHAGDFLVLCGPSGCGKSTLLRQLKPAIAPHGERSGDILFDGKPLDQLSPSEQTARIGFVLQDPENAIVTDKVWHELAFGLESLGFDTPVIRRRVAETASYFGIEEWFRKDVKALSGGQKQLLALASVMAMQPDVLILDEPTSRLDPIAASEFIASLAKINRELGTTIILAEHRLDDAFAVASGVAVMEKGHLLCTGTPSEVGEALCVGGHSMFLSMPAPMRVWSAVGWGECPASVRDGRDWLRRFQAAQLLKPLPPVPPPVEGRVVIEADAVSFGYPFGYPKGLPNVLDGLTFSVKKGELYALLGGNGAGKSTALKLLAGLEQPRSGTLSVIGKAALLPQEPQTLFVCSTVREELLETSVAGDEKFAETVRLCRLGGLLERHPYDLSGGERQRAALAKLLLTEPDILLLDEPTKGLDAELKRAFASILFHLRRQGVTVFLVSHDVEFCASYADRCALLFDGFITAEGTPREFFSGNSYYTTPANRMARGLCDAVTVEDLTAVCGAVYADTFGEDSSSMVESLDTLPEPLPEKQKLLPRWRKALAAVSAVGALILLIQSAASTDLSQLAEQGMSVVQSAGQLIHYAVFILLLVVFALATGRRSEPVQRNCSDITPHRLSLRTKTASFLLLLLVPLTLFTGAYLFDGRKYYLTAFLVLLECMAPFFIAFEGRRPKARELVVIASLAAIGVAGRAVFFMLPQFKPVMAITIIAGVALGGETGFFVGAITMLASNVLFSQGPWTPWQMFAMGFIGFLAGILFRKGLLGRSRIALSVYGAVCAIVIYGGIMNFASALMWSGTLDFKILLTYFITGFPMDCVHAAATALFLWFGAAPMLAKLDRIKTKYGLLE